MKNRTYKFYADPGHGWLKVSKKELVNLGIADKITAYSYMKGEYAYLEEDLDLSTFVKALENTGIKFNCTGTTCANRQSRIRNYQNYKYNPMDFIKSHIYMVSISPETMVKNIVGID